MGSEKRFENKIKDFLKSKGIWFVKYFANGFTKSGIPDILACHKGKFIGIEVKAENGKVSELQKYNIEKIKESGGIGLIVKPSDFEDFKKLIEEM